MQVTIEGVLHDGDGFGRDTDGQAWRVPGALPGDVVRVAGKAGKGMSVATQVERVQASADRTASYCTVARCGGCTLRELSLSAAARAKEQSVRHTLRRDDVLPIIARPELAYRHRVRLHARGRSVGYHAHGSNEIVPLSSCPVLLPRFFERLLRLSRRLHVRGEIEAVYSPVGDRLVLEAVVHDADHTLFRSLVAEGLCEGAIVVEKGKPTRRHGDPHVLLVHPLYNEARFFLEPGVFSQAHLALNGDLVRHVSAAVPPGANVLELHAGAGNLTLGLGERVIATEWDEQAVMCLRRNVETHTSRARIDALGDLAAWQKHGASVDTLVLDPPRIGARQTAAAIAANPFGVRRIVYVSCDAASLGRDLTTLGDVFSVTSLQPFDMFPGTAHVEVVAVLDHR